MHEELNERPRGNRGQRERLVEVLKWEELHDMSEEKVNTALEMTEVLVTERDRIMT